jgi:hypothetical protein
MLLFARRVKHALDVAVQRPHDTDARMHQEVAAFCGADQATDCPLPFLEVLLSLWQACDLVAGFSKR